MITPTIFNWVLAVAYVGFIFATLEFVRIPTQFLRQHHLLRVTIGFCYISLFLAILYRLLRARVRQWGPYATVIAVFFFYGYFGPRIGTPEEEIHFFEYGLVGILFYRALAMQTSNRVLIFFGALILAGIAGYIDESLQGLTRSRHYDIKDVGLNFLSAFLGLLLFQFSIKKAS